MKKILALVFTTLLTNNAIANDTKIDLKKFGQKYFDAIGGNSGTRCY